MPAKDRVSYFYDGERFSHIISLELVHVVTELNFWRWRYFGGGRGVRNFSSLVFSIELYVFGS